MKKIIWLVIPCYNEQEVLSETSKQLKSIMTGLVKSGKISDKSKIAFVNDGSKDNTWNMIMDLHESDPIFTGINLAHNKGHQNALLAGLMTAKDYADAAISLDADLLKTGVMPLLPLMPICRMTLELLNSLSTSLMRVRMSFMEFVPQELQIQYLREALHMHFISL